MRRRIIIAPDGAPFDRAAAAFLRDAALEGARERNSFTALLTGGRTPVGFYALLAEPEFRDRFPWEASAFFFGDERCVPPDHPESNYGAAQAALFSKVPVPANQVVRMRGEHPDPAAAAAATDEAMRVYFGFPAGLPRFDLVLLGVGEDGHVASLFPGSEALRESKKLVVPVFDAPPPHQRLTVTFPLINNARRVLFVCAGARKQKIVSALLSDAAPGAGSAYPAQQVRLAHGAEVWLLDASAAAGLPDAVRSEAEIRG